MSVFSMEIQSPEAAQRYDNVVSFTGRDSSGSFSILANAERRITVLLFGLASFRLEDAESEYLAVSGGVLYFRVNTLLLMTEHYLHNTNFEAISNALDNEIRSNDQALRETKLSMRRLDEEILKRLSKMNSRTGP